MMTDGNSLLSYAEGLIPNDLTIKLRVDNPFQVEAGTGEKNGYPTYRFDFGEPLTTTEPNPLDEVTLTPNIFNSETGQILIRNLESTAKISVFTANGILINQFENSNSFGHFDLLPFFPKSLVKGIYFIQIETPESWMKSLKLVKQ